MKKIIIAICGIMIINCAMGARAAKRTVSKPQKVNASISEAWGVGDLQSYASKANHNGRTDVSSRFSLIGYNSRSGTFGDHTSDPRKHCEWYGNYSGADTVKNLKMNYKVPENLYGQVYGAVADKADDEGSILPIIARKIYEHGGYFCMTQMQAGWTRNAGGMYNDNFFIDFFDDNKPESDMDGTSGYQGGDKLGVLPDGKKTQNRYRCFTVCESGWYGDTCDQQITKLSEGCPAEGQYVNYEEIEENGFNNRNDTDLHLICGCEAGMITKYVDVFDYNVNNTFPESNGFEPYEKNRVPYTVLGVLEILPNAIVVAPISVVAQYKKIIGAYMLTDYAPRMLCAPGFKLDSTGKQCVAREDCDEGFPQNVCPGFAESDFENDELVQAVGQNEQGDACWKFMCAERNYAFEPGTKECKSCPQTKHQGINANHECEKCSPGTFWFKKNGSWGCHGPDETYTTQQLEKGKNANSDCWRENNVEYYERCVAGCPDSGKWDFHSHRCK